MLQISSTCNILKKPQSSVNFSTDWDANVSKQLLRQNHTRGPTWWPVTWRILQYTIGSFETTLRNLTVAMLDVNFPLTTCITSKVTGLLKAACLAESPAFAFSYWCTFTFSWNSFSSKSESQIRHAFHWLLASQINFYNVSEGNLTPDATKTKKSNSLKSVHFQWPVN